MLSRIEDKTLAPQRIAYVTRIDQSVIQLRVTEHPRQQNDDGEDARYSNPQTGQFHLGSIAVRFRWRMAQTWSAAGYARHGRFVADLAGEAFAMLDAVAGERILDLGCGDGALTQRIQECGALVTGVDSSPELIQAAESSGLTVVLCSGEQLPFQQEFDAVFSNAALHWMRDQDAVLHGVHQALKPGGRFVAEMGGHGNIAAIRAALSAAVEPFGMDAEAAGANVFFTAAEYRDLLKRHGFEVDVIELVARPTLLPTGIEGWLQTFRRSLLDQLTVAEHQDVIRRVSEWLKPILCDRSGRWFADYVRLRFRAFARL